jgi:hypothetical protein
LSGSFTHTGISTFRNTFNDDRGYSVAFGDQNSTIYFYARNGQNLYLSDTPNTAIKNWQKSFWIKNGVAVNESLTDHFALYSADITADNAAPHFRTENGSVIKLYQNANTVAIDDVLVNTGLRASGGISNFTNGIVTGTFSLTTGANNGYILKSDASGTASWVIPSSLALPSKYFQNSLSLSAHITTTITHNLGTQSITCQAWETSSGESLNVVFRNRQTNSVDILSTTNVIVDVIIIG